jgi:hypothetical protein
VQLLPALRSKPFPHAGVPLPVAANSPLDVIVTSVTVPALMFFTVTFFPALVVPTA